MLRRLEGALDFWQAGALLTGIPRTTRSWTALSASCCAASRRRGLELHRPLRFFAVSLCVCFSLA